MTPDHVLSDARWLLENYDESRSAQFLPADRVRAICDALLSLARAEAADDEANVGTPWAHGNAAARAGQPRVAPLKLTGPVELEWLRGYDAAKAVTRG